jgi:hypothetical protein
MNRWPNFFVIGAGKSGTTSLYHYLKQHPQIFMSPVKEPKYFAFAGQELNFTGPGDQRVIPQTTTTSDAYLDLFKDAGDKPIVGEASTIYLNTGETARRMAEQVPLARLVAVLRHPADRAYSAYMHLRRDGYESLETFAAALAAEPHRIREGYYYHWHLRARGYYGRQLQAFYEQFPRNQIKVYLFEDFFDQPYRVLADIFQFLGVDDSFRPDISARHNQSGIPRNQSVQNFLTRPHPLKEWVKRFIPERIGHRMISVMQRGVVATPGLAPEIRARLTEDFREDILLLQDLIQRDLSHWLSSGGQSRKRVYHA